MAKRSNEWIKGYLEALWLSAWWKDGILYVGNGSYTYRELKEAILKENPDYKEE